MIIEYLNSTYLQTITANQDKIVSHTWSVGTVEGDNNDLAGQIADENEEQSQSANVGMITVSEYLRANKNETDCGSFSLNNTNYSTCKETNWMQSIVPSSGLFWTISPNASRSTDVFYVNGIAGYAGRLYSSTAVVSNVVSPVLYLKSDITLTGEGTEDNPYVIS